MPSTRTLLAVELPPRTKSDVTPPLCPLLDDLDAGVFAKLVGDADAGR